MAEARDYFTESVNRLPVENLQALLVAAEKNPTENAAKIDQIKALITEKGP